MESTVTDRSKANHAAKPAMAGWRAGVAVTAGNLVMGALVLPAMVLLGAGSAQAAPPESKAQTSAQGKAKSKARVMPDNVMRPHGRASYFRPPAGAVNVSVSFSVQLPLKDLKEETIKRQQESGRRLFYRLSQGECKLLLATIAESCRLSKLNVSTRLRERYNQPQMKLDVSGNARYLITLKGKKGGNDK